MGLDKDFRDLSGGDCDINCGDCTHCEDELLTLSGWIIKVFVSVKSDIGLLLSGIEL